MMNNDDVQLMMYNRIKMFWRSYDKNIWLPIYENNFSMVLGQLPPPWIIASE